MYVYLVFVYKSWITSPLLLTSFSSSFFSSPSYSASTSFFFSSPSSFSFSSSFILSFSSSAYSSSSASSSSTASFGSCPPLPPFPPPSHSLPPPLISPMVAFIDRRAPPRVLVLGRWSLCASLPLFSSDDKSASSAQIRYSVEAQLETDDKTRRCSVLGSGFESWTKWEFRCNYPSLDSPSFVYKQQVFLFSL